ncbi:hypothetical protein [Pseudanabaena phage PA-SR01]|nr:hypothetical protein [Pseudanabaena phage PA-SR01]
MSNTFREQWKEIRGLILDEKDKHGTVVKLDHFYCKVVSNQKIPTFKFEIGQEVYFLKNDKVQKGNVRVRQITESSEKLDSEREYFRRNTQSKSTIIYALRNFNDIDADWQLEESQLFASKQDLLESL